MKAPQHPSADVGMPPPPADLHADARGERKPSPPSCESVIAASADGLLALDSRLRILVFNPALEELTGFDAADVVGRPCGDVLHPTDRDGASLCETVCPAARGIRGTYDVEATVATADGRTVPVDLHFSVQTSRRDRPRFTVINVRDASLLHQIDHVRSVLVASISHELQTPISIIKAYASTLARSDAHWSEETVREKLLAIEEESDRLSGLVGRLLYTSRLEAGAISLELMVVDLPTEVQRVATRMAERDTTHEILASFPPDFPPVMADHEKLDEVLTNLIENAFKFSPGGGTVTVEGEVVGDEVRITVADEGIGLAERDQERIFERFYRASEQGTAMPPGTGLGLYICRNLVRAHGGRIWVKSKPGKGSRFTFTLPRATEE
jgi:PAS domain S-box-containing protein